MTENKALDVISELGEGGRGVEGEGGQDSHQPNQDINIACSLLALYMV